MTPYCWWFGCEQHPLDPTPVGERCHRCGGYVEYGDRVGDTRHSRFMGRLRSIRSFFWPRKCPDCGHRWQACDESVDHIPF